MKYFILLILPLASCDFIRLNNSQIEKNQIEISNILISIRDSAVNGKNIADPWTKLMLKDSSSILFFENNLNNQECVDWGGIPKAIAGHIFNISCRADFQSLFFINAIYYDDYYFSFNLNFYDTTNCYYDSIKQSYCFSSRLDYSTISNSKIEKAKLSVRKWILINEGKNLSEIRKGPRPFFDSPYYWFGEMGGLIDQNTFFRCQE